MKHILTILSVFLFVNNSKSMVTNDIDLQINVGYQSIFTLSSSMIFRNCLFNYEFGYINSNEVEHISSLLYQGHLFDNDLYRIGLGLNLYCQKDSGRLELKAPLFPIQINYLKSIFSSSNNYINIKARYNLGSHEGPYLKDNLMVSV
jgi:hypothetical protein